MDSLSQTIQGKLPVGGQDHSSSVLDNTHDGVPQEASGERIHTCRGLVLTNGVKNNKYHHTETNIHAGLRSPPSKTLLHQARASPAAPGQGSRSWRWLWRVSFCCPHCRCQHSDLHLLKAPASGWPTPQPDHEQINSSCYTAVNSKKLIPYNS